MLRLLLVHFGKLDGAELNHPRFRLTQKCRARGGLYQELGCLRRWHGTSQSAFYMP